MFIFERVSLTSQRKVDGKGCSKTGKWGGTLSKIGYATVLVFLPWRSRQKKVEGH